MWLYSADSSDPWGLYNIALHCECELIIAKINFPQSFPYNARRAIPGLWVGAPETLTYQYSFDNACSRAPTVAETCTIVSGPRLYSDGKVANRDSRDFAHRAVRDARRFASTRGYPVPGATRMTLGLGYVNHSNHFCRAVPNLRVTIRYC
jgi:hypothetical protein